jgi:P-type Ca2+ transporter type 2C
MTGLSTEQVLERRAEFGENRLPSEKGVSVWAMQLNQLKSPLVYIILIAAGFHWRWVNMAILPSS